MELKLTLRLLTNEERIFGPDYLHWQERYSYWDERDTY